ncbi:glycogen debranching enzyme [Bradyrhizobium sp. LM3.6]
MGPTDVLFDYRGLDDAERTTCLHFDPRPTKLSVNAATWQLELDPHESKSLFVAVSCNRPITEKPARFFRGLLAHRREMRQSTMGTASIETSNNIFNEVLCQSMADLNMLMTETPQGRYPYAGIPWYSTTFGRDGLITALQMLWVDPRIAKGVLRRLAHFQAKAVDPLNDAAPGKILHEMRGGEMAALREVPFAQYYGSVDSTALFVLLAGSYFERTGDEKTLTELWPAIEAGLAWIDGPGDPDKDGFVEYQRATEKGLANQGWKDSYDAIFHADGQLAEGNLALAEVQGYVFAAKRLAARCALRLGKPDLAKKLEAEAKALAERFEAAFWCEELGTYALALDGKKRPCKVRTSNAGQVLFSGMIREDRARLVAADLMGPHFYSGWGIRTVAVGEVRYNPMSYHDGSIWPHDNALIALGLARYGLKHSVAHVFKGLFDAATYMDLRRLPELFCGFRREKRRGPTLYPDRLRAAGLGQRNRVHVAGGDAGHRVRCGARRDPAAQSASAGVPARGDFARSAPGRVQRGSARQPPWRGRRAGGVAHAWPDPGLDRVGALAARGRRVHAYRRMVDPERGDRRGIDGRRITSCRGVARAFN